MKCQCVNAKTTDEMPFKADDKESRPSAVLMDRRVFNRTSLTPKQGSL